MVELRFSKSASTDLAQIVRDIHGHAGLSAATRYTQMFDRLFAQLESFPKQCAKRPRLGADIRVCVVYPYLVVYAFNSNDPALFVLRLLHGRRRLTKDVLSERS